MELFLAIFWMLCWTMRVYTYHTFHLTPRIANRLRLFSSRFDSGETRRGRVSGGGNNMRQLRVARSLRDELTEIICDVDIKATVYPTEELLRCTSISDVEVSPDLSFAKVFISVLGNSVEKRQVFVWLCENVGQIRYSLARRLKHMRRVPEITFKLSDTQATSDLIALIDELSPKAPTSLFDDDIEFVEDDEKE